MAWFIIPNISFRSNKKILETLVLFYSFSLELSPYLLWRSWPVSMQTTCPLGVANLTFADKAAFWQPSNVGTTARPPSKKAFDYSGPCSQATAPAAKGGPSFRVASGRVSNPQTHVCCFSQAITGEEQLCGHRENFFTERRGLTWWTTYAQLYLAIFRLRKLIPRENKSRNCFLFQ